MNKTLVLLAMLFAQLLQGCVVNVGHNSKASSVSVEQSQTGEYWSHRFNAKRNIAYGELPRQTLDIYQQGQWQGPPKYFVANTTAKPTLIYIHGGAWHGGVKESALWSLMPYIQKGWQVVNVEYRVGGNTAPQAADDVLLAMKWLAEHADEYAIDRNNIVISGDSAGGHLALLAGLVSTEPKNPAYLGDKLTIKAIVNWFGIADIGLLNDYLDDNNQWNYPSRWAGNNDMLELIIADYSPLRYVNAQSPAVISIHGDADKVVPIEQSEVLHQKLSQAGVNNQLVRIKGGRHLGFSEPQFQDIYQQVFTFLNQKLE